jgi:predicted ABC-type ATPase
VDISIARVAERVRHGGHDIPQQSIRRRYARSLRNLLELYAPLCDSTVCFENAGEFPRLVFAETPEGRTVNDASIYRKLLSGVAP